MSVQKPGRESRDTDELLAALQDLDATDETWAELRRMVVGFLAERAAALARRVVDEKGLDRRGFSLHGPCAYAYAISLRRRRPIERSSTPMVCLSRFPADRRSTGFARPRERGHVPWLVRTGIVPGRSSGESLRCKRSGNGKRTQPRCFAGASEFPVGPDQGRSR